MQQSLRLIEFITCVMGSYPRPEGSYTPPPAPRQTPTPACLQRVDNHVNDQHNRDIDHCQETAPGPALHLWNRLHNRNVRHSEDEPSRRHLGTTLGLLELVTVGTGSVYRLGVELGLQNLNRRPLRPLLPSSRPPPPPGPLAGTTVSLR